MLKSVCLCLLLVVSVNCFSAYPRPESSSNGMVVSAQYLATQVGSDILNSGGNAVDAAVAVGYALAVVWPCCGNIGGGGFMLVHLQTGDNAFIDFREVSPAQLTYDKFHSAKLSKNQSLMSYLSSGVPGTVMGLNAALEHYGTMSLSQVMAPAIKLAKEGFPITAAFNAKVNYHLEDFQTQEKLSKIYLDGNQLHPQGATLKQVDLSKTLEKISKDGSKAFYQGEIADDIVSDNKSHGGLMSLNDLSGYQAYIREPVVCHYRGYTILTGTPPSSGITLCEILKLVEQYDLSAMGLHSSLSVVKNVQAMDFSYADRIQRLSSYEESTDSVREILSDKNLVKFNKWANSSVSEKKGDRSSTAENQESLQTTHYSIADKWGNAVSVTYSLNGYFGNRVMPDTTGFFMNNQMLDFSLDEAGPNALAPNKRPLSSMSPVIILKDNELRYILGTPGGQTIVTQLVEVIENLIDYHMNISEAVNSCRYHIGSPKVIYHEPHCFSQDTINNLQSLGYEVVTGFPLYHEEYWGGVAGISIESVTHKYQGAMDVRRPDGMAK